MTPVIDVEPLAVKRHVDYLLLSARVTGHPRRRRNGRLFFEVPTQCDSWLAIGSRGDDLHDALARALVFSAMEAHCDLAIHGRVSASLCENLAAYQAAFCRALPQYRPAAIRADEIVAQSQSANGTTDEAIMGFSGGLDSIYTLYTHQRGIAEIGSRRIPHCVFVHGFDIPLRDGAYLQAFTSARHIADALGSQLLPLRTNLKEMLPHWPHTHGAALVAVLSLFAGKYATAIVASTLNEDSQAMLACGHGSTPGSDPLLSAQGFQVLHDTAKSRAEKSEILREFAVGRRHLRVCWAGNDLSGNCGACSKCVLQMLAMRAAGVDDFSAFRSPLTVEKILRFNTPTPVVVRQFQGLINYAAAQGHLPAEMLDAMRQRVRQCATLLAAGHVMPPGPLAPLPRKRPRIVRWAQRLLGRGAEQPSAQGLP